MRRLAVFTVFFVAASLACVAQEKTEVYGGYSFLRSGSELAGASPVNANGWAVSATRKFNRFLGATAEVNGEYPGNVLGKGNSGNIHNFLFGPTVSYSEGKLMPFAHALYGFSHLDGSSLAGQNSFTMAYGGGLDVKVAPKLALRLGQFDYVRTQFDNSSQNHFRYSAGVVLRF